MKHFEIKKYIYAFFITVTIFLTALFLGTFFNTQKINELKAEENKLSIDILSSETRFALLGELSCDQIASATLSDELNQLGEKLAYIESKFGSHNEEFISLKKYYSLLEIKDYLLSKKLKGCANQPIPILYFYGENCPECDKEGYVLTFMRQRYPALRIYSFDAGLDLSAVKTLASVYTIGKTLPALVIKGTVYDGFKKIEDIKKILPNLVEATSTHQ